MNTGCKPPAMLYVTHSPGAWVRPAVRRTASCAGSRQAANLGRAEAQGLPNAVIWMDSHTARVIRFDGTRAMRRHIDHVGTDQQFYREVTEAVDTAADVLLTGPDGAKNAWYMFVQDHHAELAGRIIGIQPLSRSTDEELLALGRRCSRDSSRIPAGEQSVLRAVLLLRKIKASRSGTFRN
jgi:hypothetical protein